MPENPYPQRILDMFDGRGEARLVHAVGADEQLRVSAVDALDDRWLACVADIVGLHGTHGCFGTGDAQRPQPSLVEDAPRFLDRQDRLIGVHPRRQVPQPLPTLAAGDRDLASLQHEPGA